MKKILAALAITCLAAPVHAQGWSRYFGAPFRDITFAAAGNASNGEIVLLAIQRDCPSGQLGMFSYTENGRVAGGCWKSVKNHISVQYFDGKRIQYENTGWIVNPLFEKTYLRKKLA